MERLIDYCVEQNKINEEAIKKVIEFVNRHNGEIDTDNAWRHYDTLYAYVFDESVDHYRDFEVDKVKVEDGTLFLHVIWEEYDYEDNWYSINGGMVLVAPTLYNLCECLVEYV
jgi:hypothetical protein